MYNSGFNYHFYYDGLGNRHLKEKRDTGNNLVYSINYYYDGDKLIEEKYLHASGETYTLSYIYDGNELIGFYYIVENTRKLYYYVRDILGNILKIVERNAGIDSVVVEYNLDPWGKVIGKNGSKANTIGNINPFIYKGYYYDEETQLYWLSSRYYSPELCRFISPDSIEYLDPESVNGLNLYCYCMNNPISYADPSGHLPEWAAWLISGAAIVGGIVLTVATAGIGSVIGGALIGAGSLINGYVIEANGGDFTAGYIGGAISGALCGLGAGFGGAAFVTASKAVNFACMGYLALGVTASFAGGFAGNLAGTFYSSWHNSGFKSVDINWGETIGMSTIMGLLNIFAGMGAGMSSVAGSMARTAIDDNSKFALKLLSGLIAGGTEAAYDISSYLINRLIAAF